MISTTRIEYELTRCINIRYALIELYLDATIWGVANRLYKSIKDVMTLYGLEKALYNAVYYGYDETEIESLIFKIREYLGILNYTSIVDFFYLKYPTLDCPSDIDGNYVIPVNPVIDPVTPIVILKSGDLTEWRSKDLVIIVDGQTTISDIGFNVADVDVDTIRLEVQGDDTVYNTNPVEEGYHIVGTTLHWHHFYDLKVGMQITIKWREE